MGADVTFTGNAGSGQSQEKQNQQGRPQKQFAPAHGGAGCGVDVLLPRQTGLWSPAALPDSRGQAPFPRMPFPAQEAGRHPAPSLCDLLLRRELPFLPALLIYLKETL